MNTSSSLITCPACENAPSKNVEYAEATIHLCSQCGLQWATFKDTEINLATFNHPYMDPKNLDVRDYGPYRDFFSTLSKLDARDDLKILDIGSGNGVFIREALQKGYDTWGVENDLTLKPLINDEIKNRIYFKSAEELGDLGETFDVITFWDSFEHIGDPFALLNSLRSLLNKDGFVFIRTNNNHDIYNLVTKGLLWLFPPVGKAMLHGCFHLPYHHWNFNHASLEAMLHTSSWGIIQSRATETPSRRLTRSPVIRLAIEMAYFVNRLIRGGKIGEYFLRPRPSLHSSSD